MMAAEPLYNIGDTVKYGGRQGRIIEVFKQQSFPQVVWRYIILLRNGCWSVSEDGIEKLVKKVDGGNTDR